MGPMPSARSGRAAVWMALFAGLVAFFAATYSFRDITDTDVNSLQTRALVLHGDIDVSRYQLAPKALAVVWRGGRYSIYGVGVSLPAAPIYAVATRMGASEPVLQAAASIPFVAVSVLLMFTLLLRLFPRGLAVGGTVLFAFGTTMWPLAAMGFFQNGPQAVFQLLGLLGVFTESKWGPPLAGLGFAAATFVRPLTGIALIFAGLFYLLRGRRYVTSYVLGAVLPLLGVIVQNRWIWGGWLTGGYSHNIVGFHGDVPHALWGLLFGWWRGLFVYSPVLVVAFVGFVIAARRRRSNEDHRMLLLGAIAVATVALYAKFTTWHGGGNQFGYRYLLDAVPFLIPLVLYAIQKAPWTRRPAVLLGALSILTTTFGAGPNNFGYDAKLFTTRFDGH